MMKLFMHLIDIRTIVRKPQAVLQQNVSPVIKLSCINRLKKFN